MRAGPSSAPGLAPVVASSDLDALAARTVAQLAPDGPALTLVPFFKRDKGSDGVLVGFRVSERAPDRSGSNGQRFFTVRIGDPTRLARQWERMAKKPVGLPDWVSPGALSIERGELYLPFPLDRRLTALRTLVRPKRARRVIEEGVGGRDVLGVVSRSRSTFQCVSYRPERRAVLHWNTRLRSSGGRRASFHLRVHAVPPSGDALRARQWLTARQVHCPSLLLSRPDGVQLETSVPGVRITRFRHFEAAGRSLAHVHDLGPCPGLKATPPPHGRASACLSSLGRSDARAGARARAILEELSAARPSHAGRLTTVHGDAHRDQFLVDGERIWVLDWDRAGVGVAASDLASIAAHAVLESPTWPDLWGSFLQGYGAARPVPPRGVLGWHVAMGLLRLVDAPWRRCMPDAAARVARLLDAADRFTGMIR